MALRLDDLQPELVQIILEYVHDSTPHTIRSVALVNKYFYATAQVIRNRRRRLYLDHTFQKAGLGQNQYAWTRDATVLQNVRHLTIDGTHIVKQIHKTHYNSWIQSFSPLCNLIDRISKLKSLTWNIGPLPKTIIEALGKKHPAALLRLFNYWRKDHELGHMTEDELAVSSFENLTDFRAVTRHDVTYVDGDDYCLDIFKHMISNSQSLQYAGIIDSSSAILSTKFFPSDADDDTRTTERKRCNSLKTLTLDSTQLKLSKSTLEDLDRFINIANLETLKFVRGQPELDYFQHAAAMLPSIKHVSLNFQSMVARPSGSDRDALLAAANDYLLNCPPLQSLSIWNALPHVNIWKTIDHHSTTIQALQIHQKEYAGRDMLPLGVVNLLRKACPKLMDLTIDINRNPSSKDSDDDGEYGNDNRDDNLGPASQNLILERSTTALRTLDEIALFGPRLRRLQVYIDSLGLYDLFLEFNQSLGLNDGNEDIEILEYEEITTLMDGNASDYSDSIIQLSSRPIGDQIQSNSSVPPPKKARVIDHDEPVNPEVLMKRYAIDIWKRVYGNQQYGERVLDVKFGEWEGKAGYRSNNDPRRLFEVRPHERDDMVRCCFTRTKKLEHH